MKLRCWVAANVQRARELADRVARAGARWGDMSTTFKPGDRVAVLDLLYPEGPHQQYTVSRVTRRTLRLRGDTGPTPWHPDGWHQISRTLRLVHLADLPAAQEEACRVKAERDAWIGARGAARGLAAAISIAADAGTTAAEVRAKVAEVLRAALAEWSA